MVKYCIKLNHINIFFFFLRYIFFIIILSVSITEQICFIFKCSNWHATFLIIHSEPLEGHHTHWKLQKKKKKLWPMLMLMWFPFLGGGVKAGAGLGEGEMRAGVTWKAVRLLSHGLCLQAELRGGGVLQRSLCKKKPAVFFM